MVVHMQANQTDQVTKQAYSLLVAEDEPILQFFLKELLGRAGYSVTVTGNGAEALEQFKGGKFSLVVTDWRMPVMDGVELCQTIRQISPPGYVYIVLLTVKDTKSDIVQGLEAGADDYLTKPFEPNELLARLNVGRRIVEKQLLLKEAGEKSEQMAMTDPLTGLNNRRFLSEHLPKELKRALRYRRPLALIMCDIDHFKKINDTYGHTAGDLVLKTLADCFREQLRTDVDLFVRYGGEEFIIVLPETNVPQAIEVAERLRKIIAAKPVNFQDKTIKITVSFGVSGLDDNCTEVSPDKLIDRADELLYDCKKEGRNRVKG